MKEFSIYDEEIRKIQDMLMISLDRLDKTDEKDISEEVARSNAISKTAITYIHTCNLMFRLEEKKEIDKQKRLSFQNRVMRELSNAKE